MDHRGVDEGIVSERPLVFQRGTEQTSRVENDQVGLSGRTLGLHSSGVGDEEGSVVSDERLLEVERGGGVNVLGVVLDSQEKGDWLVE